MKVRKFGPFGIYTGTKAEMHIKRMKDHATDLYKYHKKYHTDPEEFRELKYIKKIVDYLIERNEFKEGLTRP